MARRKMEIIKNLAHLHITLSEYVAQKMVNWSITPNQLSWLSLVSVLISAVLFSFGNYFYSIFGVLFFHFSLFLNRLDGALVRARDMVSKITSYGLWINDVFDDVRSPIVIIGIIIGASAPIIGVIGCVAITSSLYTKIVLRYGKSFLSESPRAIPQLFESIFGKVLHYSIVILALLNAVQFFVLIFASYSLVRCLVTFYTYDTKIRSIVISKVRRRKKKIKRKGKGIL